MIELLPEQDRTRWFLGPTGGGDLFKYVTQECRLSGESVWLRKVVGKCKCTQKRTFPSTMFALTNQSAAMWKAFPCVRIRGSGR